MTWGNHAAQTENAMDEELKQQLESLHAAAFGWAVSCCIGDVELAKDVLQEAYCRLLTAPDRFRQQSSLRTWLFGIIRLTSLELRRGNARWNLLASGHELIPTVACGQPGPEQSAATVQRREILWSMLRALSDRQREALHLVFYEQLTLEEAAEAMEVSVGTARQHYARGKSAMKAMLKRFREEV